MPLDYTIARLVETITDLFEINTVAIKDDLGKVSFRNESDTDFVDIATSGVEVQGTGGRVKLQPPTLSGDVDFTLPNNTGTNTQFIQTDGSGNLAFANAMIPGSSLLGDLANTDVGTPNDNDILQYNLVSGNWESTPFTDNGFADSFRIVSKQFTEADGPTFTIFTPDNGTVIKSVAIRVDTPALSTGDSPRVEIGTATDVDAYFELADSNLELDRIFERVIYSDVLGLPDEIIGTITNTGSKAFTATVYITHAVPTVI